MKRIATFFALVMVFSISVFSLSSCDIKGILDTKDNQQDIKEDSTDSDHSPCNHIDADDDTFCDLCAERYDAGEKIVKDLKFQLNGDGSYYTLSDYAGDGAEVVIPADIDGIPVRAIGENAFSGSKTLTIVHLPNSVTSIGKYAFSDCKSLKNVYYRGTQAQWNEVSVGNRNTPLGKETIYFYSEELPSGEGSFWHYGENGEILIW